MIPMIEAAGGRVLVRVRVKEILVSDGHAVGVKVTKGKQESINYVRCWTHEHCS